MHEDNDRNVFLRWEKNQILHYLTQILDIFTKNYFWNVFFEKRDQNIQWWVQGRLFVGSQIIPEHLLDDFKVELKQIYFGYSWSRIAI